MINDLEKIATVTSNEFFFFYCEKFEYLYWLNWNTHGSIEDILMSSDEIKAFGENSNLQINRITQGNLYILMFPRTAGSASYGWQNFAFITVDYIVGEVS